jgi:hypothetical protein
LVYEYLHKWWFSNLASRQAFSVIPYILFIYFGSTDYGVFDSVVMIIF